MVEPLVNIWCLSGMVHNWNAMLSALSWCDDLCTSHLLSACRQMRCCCDRDKASVFIVFLPVFTAFLSSSSALSSSPPFDIAAPAGKWNAVVTEIKRMVKTGRPVLVGTTSVEKSEMLAGKLREEDIKCQVHASPVCLLLHHGLQYGKLQTLNPAMCPLPPAWSPCSTQILCSDLWLVQMLSRSLFQGVRYAQSCLGPCNRC